MNHGERYACKLAQCDKIAFYRTRGSSKVLPCTEPQLRVHLFTAPASSELKMSACFRERAFLGAAHPDKRAVASGFKIKHELRFGNFAGETAQVADSPIWKLFSIHDETVSF